MNEKNKIPKRKIKTYKDEYYSMNSLFGNEWAKYFYLLGGREAGKSYAAMQWIINRKLKNPEGNKFYWFRLTEASQKKLLAGGAKDFIDPDVRRKYNIKTEVSGNQILTYKEETYVTRNGNEKTRKVDQKELCRAMACSTFYNDKGIGYFDNEYKGEYYVVLDEMNREQSERNTFDIVYAFVNQLENVLRSTKCKVRVVMIGNTLEEASDLLSNINFLPDGFGRYKLKRKKTIVDYIKPNEKYIERRKEATANEMMGDASTFTNEIEIDRSLICKKRERKSPMAVIKFSKRKCDWFTLWNCGIIAPYNKENKEVISMVRYLDEVYNKDKADAIVKMFDVRAFRFITLACFKQFQKQLKLIKPNR